MRYAVLVLECNETHRWTNFLRVVEDFLKLMPKNEQRCLKFSQSYRFLSAFLGHICPTRRKKVKLEI